MLASEASKLAEYQLECWERHHPWCNAYTNPVENCSSCRRMDKYWPRQWVREEGSE